MAYIYMIFMDISYPFDFIEFIFRFFMTE